MTFNDYISSMAAPGTWAGKLEAQVLAEALNMRFLVYTSWDEVLDINPEANDVACFFFNYHIAAIAEVDPALVGGKRLGGGVCLFDLASSSKKSNGSSLRLSDFASAHSKQASAKARSRRPRGNLEFSWRLRTGSGGSHRLPAPQELG